MAQLTKFGKVLLAIGIAWGAILLWGFDMKLLNSQIWDDDTGYAVGEIIFYCSWIPFIVAALTFKKGEEGKKGLHWSWSK